MGCGASTNVQARLDYITLLEAEVQDLKAQRGEALQVGKCTCHETQGGTVTPCRPQFPPALARVVIAVIARPASRGLTRLLGAAHHRDRVRERECRHTIAAQPKLRKKCTQGSHHHRADRRGRKGVLGGAVR